MWPQFDGTRGLNVDGPWIVDLPKMYMTPNGRGPNDVEIPLVPLFSNRQICGK